MSRQYRSSRRVKAAYFNGIALLQWPDRLSFLTPVQSLAPLLQNNTEEWTRRRRLCNTRGRKLPVFCEPKTVTDRRRPLSCASDEFIVRRTYKSDSFWAAELRPRRRADRGGHRRLRPDCKREGSEATRDAAARWGNCFFWRWPPPWPVSTALGFIQWVL